MTRVFIDLLSGGEKVSKKWNEILGERIKLSREIKGYSKKELSNILEIHWTHLDKIEQGKRLPSLSLLHKIIETLEVSADYLLGLTDNPTPCTKELPEHIKKQLEEYQRLKEKHSKLLQLLEEGLKNYK